jgi:hypothetical protein
MARTPSLKLAGRAKIINGVSDVVRRLVMSHRATDALEDHLKVREREGDKAKLFLLLFRERNIVPSAYLVRGR